MREGEGLKRPIEALREAVPIRAEWRASLERALHDAPVPLREVRRGWHVSPVVAIAAALVCMVIGATANQLLWHGLQRHNNASGADLLAARSAAVGVRFSVLAPGVKRVSLVGDFNGWNADATPLELARDGQTWTTMLPLPRGRHAYAFVIDGLVVRDPAAPALPDEDFGVTNSMVLVSSR